MQPSVRAQIRGLLRPRGGAQVWSRDHLNRERRGPYLSLTRLPGLGLHTLTWKSPPATRTGKRWHVRMRHCPRVRARWCAVVSIQSRAYEVNAPLPTVADGMRRNALTCALLRAVSGLEQGRL